MEFHFSKSPDVFDEKRSWKWRVLRASLPTEVGLIVLSILGMQTKNGFSFGPTCDIRLDGMVETVVKRPGLRPRIETIGSIVAVRDSVRRLADHCKLSDGEREALFDELRKWVRRDARATSGEMPVLQ